jgi:Phage portal protein, SPP1 Gp6-like
MALSDPYLDGNDAGSPGWWLQRLGRRLDGRVTDMTKYADYYAGKHPLMFATQKFREAFGDLFKEVAVNFCEVVVDKLVERLEVQGFRMESGEEANEQAWDFWQRNRLDADFAKGIREGLIKGEFSMMVWKGEDGRPRLTVEDPLLVVVAVDPADTFVRRASLKRWYDADYGQVFATLTMPDFIYKFQSQVGTADPLFSPNLGSVSSLYALNSIGGTTWERRTVENEPWPLPNALGVVPVVPFPNKPDLADIGVSELVIPIQDAINKLMSDLLLGSEFGAFRQRYAVNVNLEVNPDTGRPIEPWRIAVDRLLTAPPPADPAQPEVKFGEFGQTDLNGYISAIEMSLKDLAVITRMPPHYLLGNTGVWPSGESLRSAETGLVRKAQDRMRDLSEPLEEVIRLAFKVAGQDISDAAIETLWANPETQTESAHIDALVKMGSLGVPEEGLWEEIPASPTKIAHWKALREEEEKEAAAKAAAAAPPPTQIRVVRDANGEVASIDTGSDTEEATQAIP